MQATLEGRLCEMEGKVDAKNVRGRFLTKNMEKTNTQSLQNTSGGNAMMENDVVEMQNQLNQMETKTAVQQFISKTMVVRGFVSSKMPSHQRNGL